MKKAILSIALASLAFGCKSQTTDVTDTSAPAAVECEVSCEDKAAMKADCSEAKAECSTEAKVCPVTGKEMN